jgi:hypothetical protein
MAVPILHAVTPSNYYNWNEIAIYNDFEDVEKGGEKKNYLGYPTLEFCLPRTYNFSDSGGKDKEFVRVSRWPIILRLQVFLHNKRSNDRVVREA